MNAPSPWTITGKIPSARLSPLYRLSAFIASLGMVLLPLVYVGMIVAIGWWWWDFAQAGPATSYNRRGVERSNIVMYIAPLIIGALVLLFMIKPLFSRRPKGVQPRQLRREDEPVLFQFIEKICDLVGAPYPKRVQVDLEVNASASLTHGFWSLFSRDLTLTIGLPLANGLSVRELGGVLAHEFGHFAQGAGMKTSYVVRMVSFWFARVVYERDRMDATLEEWARNSDWRVMILLQIARLFIWLTRRVLWVLMLIGQFISSVLMRQMEFDADHYEIQASGSEGFIRTARQLRVLGVGSHIAHNKMQEAYQSRRLVDDLPGFMAHETSLLPQDAHQKLAEAADKQKTGWLDTHPSDSERIARARSANADGVLKSDAPGAELFSDFAALSREVTISFYRDVLELPVKQIALQPLSKMTEESAGAKRGAEAMDAYFDSALSPRTMIFLTPADLELPDPVQQNLASRRPVTEDEKARIKEVAEVIERERIIRGVRALGDASIAVQGLAELKLQSTKPDYLVAELKAVNDKAVTLEVELAALLTLKHDRLGGAISFLLAQPDVAPELNAEVRRYISILRSVQMLDPTLRKIDQICMGLAPILSSLERASNQQAVYNAVSERTTALSPLCEHVLTVTRDVAYPFEHAGGVVKLAQYLIADVGHPDGLILSYLRANAIRERMYTIYARIMGRLALLALDAESKMPATAGSEAAAAAGSL